MFTPLFWIRLINRDDLRQIRLGKRYLKMQWPSSRRETQQQRTRRIFVFRVILDHFRFCAGIANFLFADVSFNRSSKSVTAEFKFSSRQLLLDLQKCFHFAASSSSSVSRPRRYLMS